MRVREFSTRERAAAAFALIAFLAVLLGLPAGFAADPDAVGEPCVGCAGCETGQCGDEGENPLTAHHHCCTTCCMSHAQFELSTAHSTTVSVIAKTIAPSQTVTAAGRCSDTPYRPPRV